MPRRPRLELPGLPLHITHRGVNRAATFLDDEDFVHYRELLHDALAAHEVALHAYVLMTNHVHLLLTPPQRGVLAQAMRRVGQRYVPAFNRNTDGPARYGRGASSPAWWIPIGTCSRSVYRYIELNPVRAALAEAPERYRWSSVHANLAHAPDLRITPHTVYLQLAPDSQSRGIAYRQWLYEALHEEDIQAIRAHLQQERALGSPRFQAMVEKTLNRPAACRPRGRPRQEVQETVEE